jgi:N-acetylmuramoyl-L-alanine amidase
MEPSNNMKKVSWGYLVVLMVCGLAASSFHEPLRPFNDGKIHNLVIDAGHGGKDPGALGAVAQEKQITLAIALELKRILAENSPEVKVNMTRDDDTFIELHKRGATVAEAKADFFISIHCNSNVNKEAYGAETYILGTHKSEANMDVVMRENSVILQEKDFEAVYDGFDPNSNAAYIFFNYITNVHMEESAKLASKVQGQFATRVGRKDRGVKQAGYLVLWRASKPAILIETGFISNAEEEKFLNSDNGKTYMASAIYRAIRDYNGEAANEVSGEAPH